MFSKIIPYEKLTLDEFHDIISLRIKVFVVEQECPYQELDGLDKKAQHLICRENGTLAATLRILPPGLNDEMFSIGRVVVDMDYRGTGLGHRIMEKAINHIQEDSEEDEVPIKISAQEHLRNYYELHGFKQCGEGYLEDGIPHIPMLRISS